MEYFADVDYWRVEDLFSNINPSDILLNEHEKKRLLSLFIADMSVEYDAKKLFNFITNNLKISQELEHLLKPWQYEELKHADAFRKIIIIIYQIDEQMLLNDLQKRTCNFKPYENILDDEFKICVLLAYDECSTTIAYRKDSFYQHMGPDAFKKWHRFVIADEARHLKNAVPHIPQQNHE
jgi:hypothetical protein